MQQPFLSKGEAQRGAEACEGPPGGVARQESDLSLQGGSPGSTTPELELGFQPWLERDQWAWGQGLGSTTQDTAPGAGGKDFPTVKSGQILMGERRADKVTLSDPNTGIGPEARRQGEDRDADAHDGRLPRIPDATQ